MHRRYSRFTARLTVAGDTPKDLATRRSADSAGYHLDDRGLLLLGQPARSAQFLAVRLRLLQTRLGTAADGHQFLGYTQAAKPARA